MPRGDRTGPLGRGQMSGRALGFCAGYGDAGYVTGDYGACGFGRGRNMGGRGLAFRNGAVAPGCRPFARNSGIMSAPTVNEVDRLKAQIDGLEKSLHAVKQRLQEVEGAAD